MTTYVVSWSIEVDAENAIDAARQALGIQRDPESIATVFGVEDGDTFVTVDLEEYENTVENLDTSEGE